MTHKVVDSQMPPMDYAPTEHGHTWGEITGKPEAFTPSAHAATHGTGGSDPITPAGIGADPAGAAQAVRRELDAFTSRRDNPHGVTAAQVEAHRVGVQRAKNLRQ